MAAPTEFYFESAPELPGIESVAKAGLSGVRRMVNRLWDLEVAGVEHIPRRGAAILAPNHLSFCDSVFVPCALPRRAWTIGKGEYMDDWKTKHLFPAMGMIPVDRSGGDAAQVALDTAADVLKGGHLFMIYPEGTRSRSGFLHKGRTGAARLAAECNAPIIPVGHIGTLEVQPPDTFTMKIRKPVKVRFGAPMHPDDFGDRTDPRVLRRFTDSVMYEISQLSGQTYVDQYASGKDKPGQLAESRPKAIPVPVGRPRAAAPLDLEPIGSSSSDNSARIPRPPRHRHRPSSSTEEPAPVSEAS